MPAEVRKRYVMFHTNVVGIIGGSVAFGSLFGIWSLFLDGPQAVIPPVGAFLLGLLTFFSRTTFREDR